MCATARRLATSADGCSVPLIRSVVFTERLPARVWQAMNPELPGKKPDGYGGVEDDNQIKEECFRRKIKTLQVHVKLPMLVAGFILVVGFTSVRSPPSIVPTLFGGLCSHPPQPTHASPSLQCFNLLHPLLFGAGSYAVVMSLLIYATLYSDNETILRMLGYSGPQFYCNTACVRQNFGEEAKNKYSAVCFAAGLHLFEYVRGRRNAL